MKNITTLLLLFFSVSAFSQPTINSDVMAPLGYVTTYWNSSTVTSFNPGSAGANATWNFANADTALGSRKQKVVRADTTSNYFDFPSVVNRAIEVPALFGSYAYAYYYADNSTFDYYGTINLSAYQVYTNPQKQLSFPFTYNSQFTDVFHDADSTYYGTTTVVADAYGTLILPSGTYNNVLRIKYSDYYREIIDWDFNGNPSDSVMYEGTYYRWYMPNHVSPLLEYSKLIQYVEYLGTRYDTDSSKHLALTSNVLTGIEEQADFLSSIFPNPTQDVLSIQCEVPVAKLEITDLSGKLIISETGNSTTHQMNVSSLASGTYMLHITTVDNRKQIKKMLHL